MKVVYSSVISTAFTATDSVSSHAVFFTAYQFGVLFVALVTLSVYLLKAYNKRRSRVSLNNKSRGLQAVKYPAKPKIQSRKISPHKKQDVKEVRSRLSKKAKKRLRAAAKGKETPLLPITSMTKQPDRDDILEIIDDVSSQNVFVEYKEKKATPVKKVRKVREVAGCNISVPVVPVVAYNQSIAVKTVVNSKTAVVTHNVSQNVQNRKSRRPRRREFTLNDYILSGDMHLDAYVQTYRV